MGVPNKRGYWFLGVAGKSGDWVLGGYPVRIFILFRSHVIDPVCKTFMGDQYHTIEIKI